MCKPGVVKMNMKLIAVLVAVIVVVAVVVPVVFITTKTPAKAKNKAPVAVFTPSATKVLHNKNVTLDATGSHDPNKKDKLTYSWDLGDGATATSVSVTHKYTKDGIFTVKLTVSDGKLSNSTSQKIEAYNAPPQITSSNPTSSTPSITEVQAAVFNFTATDANGDALSISWLLDNKTQIEEGHTFNYNADFNSSGVHIVKVVVSDGKANDTKTWTLTVVNVNRAPEMVSTDPVNTDTSTIEGGYKVFGATASDPDGDNLTATWTLDSAVKLVQSNKTSQFNYTPDFNANGTHILKVSFSDGHLVVDFTWTILVPNVNRGPVISGFTPLTDMTINETEKVDFNINAMDPDGDTLTYNFTLNGVQVSNLKSYTFLTNYESAGTYAVNVTVSDGSLNYFHHWNVIVLNLNRAPTAVAFSDLITADIGVNITFNGSLSTDPDNDTLTYLWDFGDGSNTTGVNITHAYSTPGDFTVNLTVTDIHSASSSAEFVVNITKPVPTLDQLWNMGPLTNTTGQMAIGDIDLDGILELVVGYGNGTDGTGASHGAIYVYNLATHAIKWQSDDIGTPGALHIAQMDADPALEVVVSVVTKSIDDSSTFSADVWGKIIIFDGISHAKQEQSQNVGGILSMVVTDVNADAKMEVLVGYTYNMTVNASTFVMEFKGGMAIYDNALNQLWNSTGWGMTGVLAAQNLDADAPMEIVVNCVNNISFMGSSSMNISVFEWSTNKPVQSATVTGANAMAVNAWDVADIDNDGSKEILLGYSSNSGGTYSGHVVAYDAGLNQKWQTQDIGGIEAINVSNIDGTGTPEILLGLTLTEDFGTYTGMLMVLDKDGNLLWNTTDIGSADIVMTGDVDGDANLEIVVAAIEVDDGMGSVTTTIHIYSGTTHKELAQIKDLHSLNIFDFILADVDNNGKVDVVLVDWIELDGEAHIMAFGFL
jgi:PKD repeat protein